MGEFQYTVFLRDFPMNKPTFAVSSFSLFRWRNEGWATSPKNPGKGRNGSLTIRTDETNQTDDTKRSNTDETWHRARKNGDYDKELQKSQNHLTNTTILWYDGYGDFSEIEFKEV